MISAAWFFGGTQSIAPGGWHDVEWSAALLDTDDYFDSGFPAEVQLTDAGLFVQIIEVAWQPGGTGVRGLRIVQGGFVIAQSPWQYGMIGLPAGEKQHQSVPVQPGGDAPCKAQVCQTSGAPLSIVTVPFSAPSMMIARIGDL